jgi:8-oxo-dGTP diphosphatase
MKKNNSINKNLTIEEIEFLKTYDINKFERPVGVPADIVIFTITSEFGINNYPKRELKILLIKRNNPIQKGKWALPGGFSNPSETLFQAAQRELKEETGIDNVYIEELGAYDTPGRDPRGWVISLAFLAFVNEKYLEKRKAADDADDVQLFTIDEALSLDLAFDHKEIIQDGLKEIESKMLTTNVAKEFLPEEFTLEELRQVLSVVPEFKEGKENFHKKMKRTKSRLGIIDTVKDHKGELKTTNKYSQHYAQLFTFTDFVPKLSIYG